ncbi:class I adenylate-forming enzyme family protein [Actinokineospora enzanensis]|uniref:class I adenylate-forming enzyme family protein n=1 Tax=Actinokineospora enzanensis TaxID=155975 RepID=UPI00039ED43F|nr:class I adenylate-forming enzyme family protein [Actinokineospora enzanensis]
MAKSTISTAPAVTTPRFVHELLDTAAARWPSSSAVCDAKEKWTYAELRLRSLRCAELLSDNGIMPGDRVAATLPNSVTTAMLLYACSRAGAVFVPLSPSLPPERLRVILADARPALVITAESPVPAPSLSERDLLVATATDPVNSAAGADRNGDALLLYTSGSTSAPKGVLCPHAGVLFATTAIGDRLRYRPGDRIFVRLPLSFDYGLYQLLLGCAAGAAVWLSTATPAALLREIATSRATVLPVVPTLAGLIAEIAERRPADTVVRLITNTGAALVPRTARRLRTAFPRAAVVAMYGLTECKRVSIADPDEDLARPGSVGRPLPGTRVRIVDDAGEPLPPGVIGQIVVSGPHVMAGYFGDAGATAERFTVDASGARSLRTGDYGFADADGTLHFTGRRDGIFKHKGTRMSIAEIEAAAEELPGVRAAIAVPPTEDDRLVLVVAGAVRPEEVMSGLARLLDPDRRPDVVVVMAAFPQTATGKVDRAAVTASVAP